MNITVLFPILTVLLIVCFFLCLPPARDPAPVKGKAKQTKPAKRTKPDAPDGPAPRGYGESAAVLLVTLLYALAAFSHLGDRSAPQSSVVFSDGDSVVLELDGTYDVSRAMVYSVLGTGSFSFYLSEDGRNWTETAELDQNYVALLKWHEVELPGRARFLSVTAFGEPELGEIALFSADGARLPWRTAGALSDEQSLVPEKSTFMNSSYFDEIYHARTALEHLRGVWPYEITHPPLGKLILGLGISLFGMTPFGWRFSGTLFGVLMLPLVYAFARRLFGRGSVPVCCTLLLAVDFMHFNQTRIATIDTYGVFFTLAMYFFMYRWLFPASQAEPGSRPDAEGRPLDLALAGLCFGLGAASKWTCLYAGAGLGLLWALHWIARFAREGRAVRRLFGCNVCFCLVFFVLVPAAIYYAAYYPYGIARGLGGGPGMYFTRDYARIVLDNQSYMFGYHSHVNATHPYSSRWYQWLLDVRPILYYLDYNGSARSSFGAFVNPVLCWAGLPALFVLGRRALAKRDRQALFLLLAYLAQLVPWIFITRVTFEYHYFPCSVFLVLALGYVFALMRGRAERWRIPVWVLTAAAAALFVFFYPALWGAELDTQRASLLYRWFSTWPF